MKKVILFLAFCLFAFAGHSQTVAKKDASGDYVQTEVVKTLEELTAGCEKSAAKFRDKSGKRHDVFLSPNGKMFYIATSKSGKLYRRYFKEVGN